MSNHNRKPKPKPTSAGEKIAWDYVCVPTQQRRLSRRIDRAIARAVRKERERCAGFVGIIGTRQMTKENAEYCIRKGYLFP